MLTTFIVICIYLILYALSLQSFQKALFFYVVSIMLRPLIATPFFLFIGWHDVFIFILIFHLFQKGLLKRHKGFKPKILRALVFLAVILIIIPLADSIRKGLLFEDYFGVSLTFQSALYQIFRSALHIAIILVLLNKLFYNDNLRKTAYSAMVFSAIIVVFSMFFAPYLSAAGLNVREVFEAGSLFGDTPQRLAGLILIGNVNSVATLLNVVLCKVIINFMDDRKSSSFKTVAIITLLATGVVFTASRMGLYMLLFIAVYFALWNMVSSSASSYKKAKLNLIILVGASVLLLLTIYDYRFTYLFLRIQEEGGLTDELSFEKGRSVIWLVYFNYLFNDTNSWLLGSSEVFFPFSLSRAQAPHNFLLNHVYLNGVALIILLFVAFYRLFASFIAARQVKYFIPLTVIAFISMMSQDSGVFIYYYIFCVGIIIHNNISPGVAQNNRESKSQLLK